MLELYQAEWCPYSHRVRQRLTELGVDFVARQVAADRRSRRGMRAEVGEIEIPVLVDGERTIAGSDEILAFVEERYAERPDASEHREKALDHAGIPSP